MDNHKSYLKTLESNAIKSLETLQTLEEIENWRIEYLGRKGKLSQFFQSFKDIKIEIFQYINFYSNINGINLITSFE